LPREVEANRQLAQNEATIPVTIGEEKQANPFLRADVLQVATGIGWQANPPRGFREFAPARTSLAPMSNQLRRT
jgi:hypothetical protein